MSTIRPRMFGCSPNGERVLGVFDHRLFWLNLGVFPPQVQTHDGNFGAWTQLQCFNDGGASLSTSDCTVARLYSPGNAPQMERLPGIKAGTRVRILDTAKSGNLVVVEWVEKKGLLSSLKASVRLKPLKKDYVRFCSLPVQELRTGNMGAVLSEDGTHLGLAMDKGDSWVLVNADVQPIVLGPQRELPAQPQCPLRAIDDKGNMLALDGRRIVVLEATGGMQEAMLEEGEEWVGSCQGHYYLRRADGSWKRRPWSTNFARKPAPSINNMVHAFLLSGQEEAFFYLDRPVEFASQGPRVPFLCWYLEKAREADYTRELTKFQEFFPSGSWLMNAHRHYEIKRNEHGWFMTHSDAV